MAHSAARRHNIRRTRPLAMLMALSTITALSACGSNNDASSEKAGSETPTVSTPPSPDPEPSETETLSADETAALKGYRAAWAARVDAYSKGSSKGTAAEETHALRALAEIEYDLKSMRKLGRVTTGKPDLQPEVTSVEREKHYRAVATITDCVDISGWRLVDKTTREPVILPKERLMRFVSVVTVEEWGNDRWVVTKVDNKARKC
ncbi:hypothetical protein [Streptomyces alkaliterrae]|uniref:Secreted protein/lipoprotein n=1 Tax=Streptomyces alkaliterrae TaxID=2213162 RepID=A0A5P0YK54_9ACTN|nr:hypothetical protein [Streptomyces alkaliterrae]MBB1258311.1 hypothetical protein [Streptomyces alkaliterrae]MQS00705.1 hypothetical protein [Streptomyces alkaliterrae]